MQTAQQVLKNIIDTQDKKVTIEQIQKRVGEHFGLRAQDLKIRSNSKVITFPRQVAMFLVKQLTIRFTAGNWKAVWRQAPHDRPSFDQ